MGTSQLFLYNEAILRIGERALSSINEVREPRLVLDYIWDGGAVNFCLEQGLWNFAGRTVKLEYSPSVEPPFGYRYAFDKPTDMLRTMALCSDEFFNSPLTRYDDQAGFLFSDLDTIYLRYTSNDTSYGLDLSLWPQSFSTYVACYLAYRMSQRVTQDEQKRMMLEKDMEKALLSAKSKDAMQEPTKFLPRGTWSMSRNRNLIGRARDGGHRGELIG